jgi:hypothetical protein
MRFEMTMRNGRARRAEAQRTGAALAAQSLYWSAGIAIIMSLGVAMALLPQRHSIVIAALSAVGGVAICGAIVGHMLRDVRLYARVWSAAMFAIIGVLACAVSAQLALVG